MNSYKTRYYRIDIIVGKIVLKTMPKSFFGDCEEDQLMLDLKHLCKDYDRRVGQALIPFLMERIENVEMELKKKKSQDVRDRFKKDIQFMEKILKNLKIELDNEKKELREMAQEIYDLWLKIEGGRTGDGATSQFELKVHQGDNRDKKDDVLFNLVKRSNPGKYTKEVQQREAKAARTLAYCKLVIDGNVVAETKKAPIGFPNYEIDILDQFQIHVFTLPTKV